MAETLHDWLHPVLLVAIIPFSFMALTSAKGTPPAKQVRGLFSVGILIVILASLFGHEVGSHVVETTFTMLGSGFLVAGHWRNGRVIRCTCANGQLATHGVGEVSASV